MGNEERRKQRQSLALKGRTLSAQHRQNISAGQTGKYISPEQRANMSAGQKGKRGHKHTPEEIAKRSATFRRNRAAGLHKNFHHSEEAKRRIGLASIGRHLGKPNVTARKVGNRYPEPLYVRIQNGLPVFCETHGEHLNWRVAKSTTYCRLCVKDRRLKYESKYYIDVLVTRCKLLDKNSEMTAEFIADMVTKQNNRCAFTGIEFQNIPNLRPSIDRKDSSIGYTKDNVHLVIYPVNKMKNDLSMNEFVRLCRLVATHNPA